MQASLLKDTRFIDHTGIKTPVIGGPMYPCSNPELVAAISEAGGIGVVQPISLTYVHGYDFREGLRYIRQLTDKPIGMNALIEQSTGRYHERMKQWIDIALEENIRFFITSLGKPGWVVDRVHRSGGIVYHDTTNRKYAMKGIHAGVDGLICVNGRAGGHTGEKDALTLFNELKDMDVPLICAGGISTQQDFLDTLDMGYAGVQLGTAFIATNECKASDQYKQAILNAKESDITYSERFTGVPVSVIRTPAIERMGIKPGLIARWLLKGNKTKHFIRTIYALRSIVQLKKALLDRTGSKELWQAGKSVAGIKRIRPAGEIVQSFHDVLAETDKELD
ncbi:MAG: nitronate monooxygenase [Gammaproteobacteria bacterium]|nr:MAG: nitronate monooxygenase [Gammaproteobacteria bacterium]